MSVCNAESRLRKHFYSVGASLGFFWVQFEHVLFPNRFIHLCQEILTEAKKNKYESFCKMHFYSWIKGKFGKFRHSYYELV